MYLGMLFLGWMGGLVMGATAWLGFGLPVWGAILIWSFSGAALALCGFLGLYLRSAMAARSNTAPARAG